jgi:hypothetical protein
MRTFDRVNERTMRAALDGDFDDLKYMHVPTLTRAYLDSTSEDELLVLAEILERRGETEKLDKVNDAIARR